MSILQMTKVWPLDLPHNLAWVLMALADHADDDGYCWPSVDYLAWKCGYTRRQIQRILRELEQRRLLLTEDRGPAGLVNHYRLLLDNGAPKPAYERKGRKNVTRVTATSSQGRKIDTQGGDTAKTPKPSKNRQQPSVEHMTLDERLAYQEELERDLAWIRSVKGTRG